MLKSVWSKVYRALGRRHHKFKVGDRVWLSTKNIKLKKSCVKLGPRFIGPFKIVRQINPVSFMLDLPLSMRIPKTFHCSLFRPVSPFRKYVCRPPPALVHGQPAYAVKKILDSK